MSSPLLLLDVDGVLCPFGGGRADLPCGPPGAEHVRYAPETRDHLATLCKLFEPVWATAWEHDANLLLADVFGLPQLPVIVFDDSAWMGDTWKLPAIRRFVGERPFAWVDDDIGHDAHAWASERSPRTLMLDIEPDRGLGAGHVEKLIAFACEVD